MQFGMAWLKVVNTQSVLTDDTFSYLSYETYIQKERY